MVSFSACRTSTTVVVESARAAAEAATGRAVARATKTRQARERQFIPRVCRCAWIPARSRGRSLEWQPHRGHRAALVPAVGERQAPAMRLGDLAAQGESDAG